MSEREELTAALDDTATGLWMNQDAARRGDRTWGHTVADALLPVVDRIANQRAAAELRAIVLDAQIVGVVMHERGPIRVPVAYLTERADALDPSS